MCCSEALRRKFEAEKQQLILENTDEKSGYQRLLKEFNRLEQRNEFLEEQLGKYKGGNAHKVRRVMTTMTPLIELSVFRSLP